MDLPRSVGADPVALVAWSRMAEDLVRRARASVLLLDGAMGVDARAVLRRVQHRLDAAARVAGGLQRADAPTGLPAVSGRFSAAAGDPPAPPWLDRDAQHRATLLARLHAAWAAAPIGGRAQVVGERGLAALLRADALLEVDLEAGRAVAVMGDLGLAEHVAIVVPGVGNDLANVADLLDDAAAIHGAGGDRVAAIAWLGYDTPGGVGTWELLTQGWHGEHARVASHDLAAFVGEMREVLDGRTVAVIGHSYGARVVAEAMRGPGLPVDDVVLLGAPGLGPGIDHVDDLHPGDTTVWAEAIGDPWVHDLVDRAAGGLRPVRLLLEGLGQSPTAWQLGTAILGRVLRREDPVPHLPGLHGRDPDMVSVGACGFATGDVGGHGAYFTGTSLDSIVAIVTGRTPGADPDRGSARGCAG